ncbi:hypothetical protein BN1723_018868, partial [Verticillium longisporum]
QAL